MLTFTVYLGNNRKIVSKPRIILVEPAGALNVGSIARIMKNMELEELVIVAPHCDPLGEEARRMAVHGVDVLEKARIAVNLPEALHGCQRAIATTNRERTLKTPLEYPRIALPWLLEDGIVSALIFGPEDRGLSNTELNYAQRFVGIPANPEYSSLNLAQAVALCAYELYQISQPTIDIGRGYVNLQGEDKLNLKNHPQSSIDLASVDVLESYYQHLQETLLKIGYLYPHTAAARMEKFRHLFNRSALSNEEVMMLRGILRQVNWAIKNERSNDFP